MDTICENCGQEYSSKYTLARHQKTSKCTSVSEEERYNCICGYWTTYKNIYTAHINKCKCKTKLEEKDKELKDAQTELDALNEQFVVTKAKITKLTSLNKDLRSKLASKDAEILELKLKLANGEGKIEVYKERPGIVNNQYNKLLQVKCDTIRPFTIETVREEVQGGKYTFDQYIRAEKGLVDFIAGIISQDEQRSYVCTDTSRHKFHRLLESREWQNDNGATFLNKVFDELKEPSTSYYKKICAMMEDPQEDQDIADMLMSKTKGIFFAITQPKSKERPALFSKIRNEVRHLAVV